MKQIKYDYCIVGAGIAGLILFDELVKKNINVCLIESDNNNLNKGYIAKESFKHTELHSHRYRGIGGTGQKWGGGCALLETEDFNSWPFNYDDFLKYYIMAAKKLDVEDDFLDGIKLSNNTLFNKEFKSNLFNNCYWRSTNLTENRLLQKLLKTERFNTALKNHFFNGFTLIKFTETQLLFKNNHNTLVVNYNKCVLCCGGLETPRLLLNNNFKNSCIGKYYSPHLNISTGTYHLNTGVYLNNISTTKWNNQTRKYYTSLLYKKPNKPTIRVQFFSPNRIICQADQIPNKNSGIQLHTEKDIYGQNLIILNHSVTDDEIEDVKKCLTDLNNEMKQNKIGHLTLPSNINDYKNGGKGASHHLGMTRIGLDKDSGVVNEKLKVYDTSNLYILSTSVFPTYSHAPPTFTLVALVYYFLDINL